jgi:hypothetical protein
LLTLLFTLTSGLPFSAKICVTRAFFEATRWRGLMSGRSSGLADSTTLIRIRVPCTSTPTHAVPGSFCSSSRDSLSGSPSRNFHWNRYKPCCLAA